MDWQLIPQQFNARTGQKIVVRLIFDDPNEYATIYHNECQRLEVGPHKFRDFYAATLHTTVVPIPSRWQADEYVGHLDKQLREVNKLIQIAKTKKVRGGPRPVEVLPWNFFDSRRFEHTWIVADTGQGKTTLLSALIDSDLDKVAKGEASVFVLDSEGEHLSKYLPRLERFAPSGDLAGKLVYLTPDLAHPLALNIFDFEGYGDLDPNAQNALLRTAQDMLMFFIGATVGVPTGHMKNIIGFALRALVHIPNATVVTFKDLLEKGGFAKLASQHPNLKRLDDVARKFLTTDMQGANYAPSVGAVKSRLDGILQDRYIEASFAQPQNKLRLYDLFTEPHVVVVYTNSADLGEDTTPLFGRYFLAALLRVVRRRQGGGLPVYVFADEAQMYIAEEESVITLINEARRQKVALTFAHHRSSDIKNASVLAALKGAAVHIRPAPEHHWYVSVREAQAIKVLPPPTNFEHELQMSRLDWAGILTEMQLRFGVDPEKPKTPTKQGAPNISEE